jgi:hypothetical protein
MSPSLNKPKASVAFAVVFSPLTFAKVVYKSFNLLVFIEAISAFNFAAYSSKRFNSSTVFLSNLIILLKSTLEPTSVRILSTTL